MGGQLVEYCSFVGDRSGKNMIEGGDAIGGDHYQSIVEEVDIPHFSAVEGRLAWQLKMSFF